MNSAGQILNTKELYKPVGAFRVYALGGVRLASTCTEFIGEKAEQNVFFHNNDFGKLYTYFRDAITEDILLFCFCNTPVGNTFRLSNQKIFPKSVHYSSSLQPMS